MAGLCVMAHLMGERAPVRVRIVAQPPLPALKDKPWLAAFESGGWHESIRRRSARTWARTGPVREKGGSRGRQSVTVGQRASGAEVKGGFSTVRSVN